MKRFGQDLPGDQSDQSAIVHHGKITLEEYGEWMRAFRVEEQIITDDVFQKLDVNGDGTLSLEETLQLTREFFYSDDPDARGNWALGAF